MSAGQPKTRRPATHVPTFRVAWMLAAGYPNRSGSVAARSATVPTSMTRVTSGSPDSSPWLSLTRRFAWCPFGGAGIQ